MHPQPFQEPRRARHGTGEVFEGMRDREPNTGTARKMEDRRGKPVRRCHRIEIGGLDPAIDPGLQSEVPALDLVKRAVADAMHGMTGALQLAGEMAADKPFSSCYPNVLGHALTIYVNDEHYDELALCDHCAPRHARFVESRSAVRIKAIAPQRYCPSAHWATAPL